eukprot:NODE_350_length_2402_cov_36.079473_g325_i0.p1 GENE.NODE_350_length_2402_cov_36.079473_g325_i0~~NODE_350_length_2402_cov_36.079473_g325_i0.p1  ORF type:complete len:708 (+),score=102.51 NODE_350_length_2402_cov_36.079473_g325_i0:88-2211(+)
MPRSGLCIVIALGVVTIILQPATRVMLDRHHLTSGVLQALEIEPADVGGSVEEVSAMVPLDGGGLLQPQPSPQTAREDAIATLLPTKVQVASPQRLGQDAHEDPRPDYDPLLQASIASGVPSKMLYRIGDYSCSVPSIPAYYGQGFWINKTHRSCSERKGRNFMRVVDGVLIIDCPATRQPAFIDDDKACSAAAPRAAWKSYTSPVQVHSEVIWGKCGRDLQLVLQHLPSKSLMAELKQRQQRAAITSPFNVFFVVLDSTSENHLYRKLPLTAKLLDTLVDKPVQPQDPYAAYSFRYQQVVGDNTAPNTVPLLSGLGDRSEPSFRKAPLSAFPWIFNDYAAKGFATFFGDDSSDWFPEDWPHKYRPQTHSSSHNYNRCAATWSDGCNDGYMDRRCIGSDMVVSHLFHYAEQFMDNYRDLGRWGFMQILEGHEETGSVISTIDEELSQFVSRVMESHPNTFLFVMGDHGMRYGKYRGTLGGSVEYRLPFLRLLAPTNWALTHPGLAAQLKANQHQLVTKYDIYKFQKDLLAMMPDGASESERPAPSVKGTSMMQKFVPRTCADAQIPEAQCICSLRYISMNSTGKYPQVKALAQRLVKWTNDHVASYPGATRVCPTLSLDHIKYYATLQYSYDAATRKIGYVHLLTYVTQRPAKARFEATVHTTSNGEERISLARISAFSHEDKSTCEPFAKRQGLDAFYCVCPRHDV